MKLLTMLAAALALAGCAGTPLVNGLIGPGDTLLIRSSAPAFDNRAGSLRHRSSLVVAERGREQSDAFLQIHAVR